MFLDMYINVFLQIGGIFSPISSNIYILWCSIYSLLPIMCIIDYIVLDITEALFTF